MKLTDEAIEKLEALVPCYYCDAELHCGKDCNHGNKSQAILARIFNEPELVRKPKRRWPSTDWF
jgi:hypothetical protein